MRGFQPSAAEHTLLGILDDDDDGERTKCCAVGGMGIGRHKIGTFIWSRGL